MTDEDNVGTGLGPSKITTGDQRKQGLHSLITLREEMRRTRGWTDAHTLAVLDDLRQAGAITNPRTENRFVDAGSVEVAVEAVEVLRRSDPDRTYDPDRITLPVRTNGAPGAIRLLRDETPDGPLGANGIPQPIVSVGLSINYMVPGIMPETETRNGVRELVFAAGGWSGDHVVVFEEVLRRFRDSIAA